MSHDVRILDANAARRELGALSAVLTDCVNGGASVNFMLPFSQGDAEVYWRGVLPAVEQGGVILFGAYVDGELRGTGQLAFAPQPNQPHRGDVCKMLVHRIARGRGLAGAIMRAIETEARRRGLTLLTLDTASDEAERVYQRAGFIRTGMVPNYALWPQGGFCDSVFYYKPLQ